LQDSLNCRRVARLVQHDLDTAGQAKPHGDAEALVLWFAPYLDSLRSSRMVACMSSHMNVNWWRTPES
jgi:hypothetical protein